MVPLLGWVAGCLCVIGAAAEASQTVSPGGRGLSEAEPDPNGSYLTTVTPGSDGTWQCHTEPYVPQEGDFVCFNDHSPNWKFLYRMFGSDLPDHAGLVVKLPDGRPAMLESGPDDGSLVGPYVWLLEVVPRFNQFKGQWKGCIYIRRLRCPLTPEQSAALTDWALKQAGKHYATCRLLLQGTPCRCRCGLREKCFAKTYNDRNRWLCCEIGVAALCHIGVFNPKVIWGNRTYPRDILYDDHYDISATHLPAAEWTPTPPDHPLPPIQAEIPPKPKIGRPACGAAYLRH